MRLDHRRAVPGEQPARHQPRRRRECLGPVLGGEDVRLVRQEHDVRAGVVDLRGRDRRVAAVAPGEHVGQPCPGEEVVGVGGRADHHPRVAPDRDGHRETYGGRRRPEGARLGQPRRVGQSQRRGEEARHRVERLLDRLDPGHPHRDAGLAEPAYVELAVLLLVGHDEVGGEGADRRQVGVLGAAHPPDGEVGRVGAPVGRAHQQVRRGGRQCLGQGRHERDDTRCRAGQRDVVAQVVAHDTKAMPWG